MTRVTCRVHQRTAVLLAGLALLLVPAPPVQCQAPRNSPILNLYRQLRTVELDPAQVYRARELAMDREDLHLYLTDGTLAFTKAVDGRVTGAFFEGEGEVLVKPPDQVERASLGLFTGAGVLTEKFSSAYLRFNDDTYNELRATLMPAENGPEFVATHAQAALALAEVDALRLLCSFTSSGTIGRELPDRYLHARVVGNQFGVFDLVYDSMTEEQISVGKLAVRDNLRYYNLWMSFPARQARLQRERGARVIEPWKSPLSVRIRDYQISARLLPPEEIDAEALLSMRVNNGGQRVLFFELSRFLKVSEVSSGGRPLEFIQNESLEGSELARRGNDEVAVVFAEPLKAGSELKLKFKYRGLVMTKAGEGLLYVGARGTWYPNRGMAMANFTLDFQWPSEWTLVATGRRVSLDSKGNELSGRWVSEIPMPLAGFNLGVYSKKSAKAGTVMVESYATSGMEYSYPKPQTARPIIRADARDGSEETAVVSPPLSFNPAQTGQTVAERSAKAIEQYARWFGPFPYPTLALTQFPSGDSQGWPGLIFLSGTVFLPPEDKARLKMDGYRALVYDDLMQYHETAHQWWGNLVTWRGYRDQWWVEALANYSALMLLEREHPEAFKAVMEHYRNELLKASPGGKAYLEAGPVTLGVRLSSSEFPNGYMHITYGRGTWLIHMLRCLFRDGAELSASRLRIPLLHNQDEAFMKALRNVRERYAQKELTTAELIRAFEEQMPESVNFEGKKSLEWFVDGWLKGIAIPTLKLSDVKIVTKSGRPHATFTIVQQDASKEMTTSLPIYAVASEGKQVLVGRVFADGEQTSFRLNVPPATRRLVLDPEQAVLRRK